MSIHDGLGQWLAEYASRFHAAEQHEHDLHRLADDGCGVLVDDHGLPVAGAVLADMLAREPFAPREASEFWAECRGLAGRWIILPLGIYSTRDEAEKRIAAERRLDASPPKRTHYQYRIVERA